jgi:putative ABC transport system permease protein
MRFIRRFLERLANFASRRRADQRLREEMDEHLALQTEENLRTGMSLAEARRRAVLKFGAVESVREGYRSEQSLPFAESLLQDLRYAFRQMVNSPGFASIAILTVALGIGATTAIYSVVDATLLHPLPYPQPEQLVRIQDDLPGVGARDVGLSVPEWRDLQRSGLFQYVSIEGSGSVNLTGSSQPARIFFKPVTPNYFAVLGVKPQLGRVFNPQDQTPGFNLEVVISDGLWKRAFGADPGILGKSLRLDNDTYQVTGVMPAGFRDQGRTSEERNTELWAGTGFSGDPAPPAQRSSRLPLEAIGRLQPGLTIDAAQSRLDALVASLQKQFPDDYPLQSAWTVRLVPLSESFVGNVRQPLVLLLGAVGLVLLIGCVNVANLQLARASARGREMAIRQALGAARTRLVRQLLTESLLLSLLGGMAGIGILFCVKGALLRIVPDSLPRLNEISISWSVLLFALGVSVLAGAIFGTAPALQAGLVDSSQMLRQEGRGSKGSRTQTRTRSALVISEFALSLVLMIAAGLLLRSFWNLYKERLGFDPQNVIAVQTWLPVPNDPRTDIYRTATQEATLLREILRRGRSLPGVEEVAIGDLAALPLGHGHNDLNPYPLIREGHETQGKQAPIIDGSIVSPGYFRLLGMTLLRGRLFTDADVETTPPSAVINEAMARTYWPNEDPMGKHLKLKAASPAWTTVVGIVANARSESLEENSVPQIYLSVYQRPSKDLAIFLRGQLDPTAIPEQVRQQVQSVDRELPVFGAKMLPDVVSGALSQRRFSMETVLLFALTALLLAGLGIYGTISYVVSERTREIGVRIALGAQRKSIMRMVLRKGIRLAVAGATVGLVAALIVSHLMTGLLYGVSPSDPLTFVGLTIVLTAVALAASYIPARRAMRVDPIIALRYE